jgi:Zn-finger nucleic acid-binding protein
VWLDRGELEKLMEYAAAKGAGADPGPEDASRAIPRQAAAPIAPPIPEPDRYLSPGERRDDRDDYKHYDHDDDDDRHGRHPREGHYGDDRYRDHEGQPGHYPRKKSWVSNIFEMFGD